MQAIDSSNHAPVASVIPMTVRWRKPLAACTRPG